MPSNQNGWYEPTEMYDLSRPWNVPTGAYISKTWMVFTDAYYADLDEWPIDADGHPRLEFPCHLDFDLMVGRFPVRLPSEISNIVAKSKSFTPATSVEIIDTFTNPSAPIPDDCASFPPSAGDLDQEGKCYCRTPYSEQRALEGSGITLNYRILSDTDPLARSLALQTRSILVLMCHGGHDANFVLAPSDLGSFAHIFPLYVVNSCLIDSYFWWESDSMVETMIKSPKGPVACAGPKNEYYFYRALSEGKTIGEATYNKQKIYYPGLQQGDLIGDPSLVLAVRPKSTPGHGHFIAVDPLSLVLRPDIYIKLHLPDPAPLDRIETEIHKSIKEMTPEQKKHARARLKTLKAYVKAMEKELGA
jgi:hypothetical protein